MADVHWRRIENRLLISFIAGVLLSGFTVTDAQAVTAQGNVSGGQYYSYKNLEKVLNQEDKPSDWRQGYSQIAPPARAVPGPAGESRYQFKDPAESDRSFHTFFPWRSARPTAP